MDNRQHPPRRLDFSGVVPSGILQTIVIDLVFPYMLYQLLVSHVSLLIAFAIAAIIPLANIMRTAFARRSVDLIGIIALYIIMWIFINTMVQSNLFIVSILLTYVLPIGILGLTILCSRLLARPVFFYVDQYYRIQAAEAPAVSDDYWHTKRAYRQALYRLNFVWGSGQLVLAAVVILLFVLLSAEIFSTCIWIVICLFYILLTMWSVHYIDGQTQNWNEENMHDAHTTSSLSSRQDF